MRMPAQCFLRKEQLTVDPEIEDAACAGDKGEGFDHVLIVAQDFRRHTDGPIKVVSGDAVFKSDAIGLVHSHSS